MNFINDFLKAVLPYTEWVMLFLVIGGGLFLALYSRLLPFRYFKHAIAITRGKYDHADDPGEVSHLQALSSAVAATLLE
jgi:AGCS family alanine or glycine:cation symporter